MKFYRVRPEDDQRKRYSPKKARFIGIYVANELVSIAEAKHGNYDTSRMELVETTKGNTFWCFGARFAIDDSLVTLIEQKQ